MELYEIIDRNISLTNFRAKNKQDAIRILAENAARNDHLREKGITAAVLQAAIKDREGQGSTAFGGEIAIPHARIPGMERFVVCIFSSQKGVEFDSLDHKKVKLFFIILGPPEAVNEHLKILASISRIVSQSGVKNELIKASSSIALVEAFLRHTRTEGPHEHVERKMVLLVLTLFIEDFLYNILEYYIETGIEGATILESSGMGEYISDIPIFADFIGFMQQSKNRSKTIMAMIPKDRVDEIIDGIESITGDLDKKQGAMVYTLDVGYMKGTMKMM
jgi:PTS system nitrogen regulatory IIA component